MLNSANRRRPLAAHIWAKAEHGFYIEPEWCSERLFEVEAFPGTIWDPACGSGRAVEAARRAGYRTFATDLVDRGYQHFDAAFDFINCKRRPSKIVSIVSNPPFDICDQFVRHALELATGKIAMIWLVRRLNGARWLQETPLARAYFLTPRPSMPPGYVIAAGEKPGGGRQDFCWLIWEHGHAGPAELRWLYRGPRRSDR
jgi:hypothetical protein